MNTLLLDKLIIWPKSFITGTDLRIILEGTDDARKSILKRAVQEGYLEKLKRDLYLIKRIPKKLINTFEIAQLIYGPSYISFESSLSYFGWIPESVPVTCSATIKQTKNFSNVLGIFSFEKIPNTIFSLGVRWVNEEDAKFLMADPWKSITDMIYLRNKKWDDVWSLMEDLRIEKETILSSNLALLELLVQVYPHKNTRHIAKNILDSIKTLKEKEIEN